MILRTENGFSQIWLMMIMLMLAIALPLTMKLVQQSQENRSEAVVENKNQIY